jgi:hypothetical protein
MKKLISILVAFAMMAALAVTAAFATVPAEKQATSLETAAITKDFVVPAGVTAPAANFVFQFSPKASETDQDTEAATATISFTKVEDNTAGTQVKTLTFDNFFTLGATEVANKANLPHAGTYVYEVAELGEVEGGSSFTPVSTAAKADESINYSKANYTVRIYVINDASTPSGLKIKSITVQPGTGAAADDTKVPATINPQTGKSGFEFENVYAKVIKTDGTTDALSIQKLVTGTAGDKQNAFPFTATMTIPAYAVKNAAQTITGKIGDTEVKFEFAANANEATAEFALADTQKLTFASIPAGTTVDITETLSTSNIQNQAKYTQTVSNLTALADDDQTAPADTTIAGKDLKATTGSLDAATAAVVTNNLNDADISPEGILISNLPYIALALVAIGGLVAYVVIRRRNADEA